MALADLLKEMNHIDRGVNLALIRQGIKINPETSTRLQSKGLNVLPNTEGTEIYEFFALGQKNQEYMSKVITIGVENGDEEILEIANQMASIEKKLIYTLGQKYSGLVEDFDIKVESKITAIKAYM